MSSFADRDIACPGCGDIRARRVALGVNAGRSPHLREAILAGDFQIVDCEACDHRFAVDDPFTYVDFARRQWLCCVPAGMPRSEEAMRQAFERASHDAQRSGVGAVVEGLEPRVVRGLLGLRERLLCDDAALPEAAFSRFKRHLLAEIDHTESAEDRLCLVDSDDDELTFWLLGPDERIDLVQVPVEVWRGFIDA